MPSTYVPYIFQNVLLVLHSGKISLQNVSPLELRSYSYHNFFLISEELLNEVRIKFLSGLGPTVHCRKTLILPKYRVREQKISQAAHSV